MTDHILQVDFSLHAKQLMAEIGVTDDEARRVISDPHQGLRDGSLERIAAVRWFKDGRVVFVDSMVTRKEFARPSGQLIALYATAVVVVEIGQLAKSGTITRGMDMEPILALVAEHFGLRVRCHPEEPFTTLYTGRYRGTPDPYDSVEFVNPGNLKIVEFIGVFKQQEAWCELFWAFDFEAYRRWRASQG